MNKYQKQMSKAAKRNYKMFGVIESYDTFYRKFKRENKQYQNFKKHRKKYSKALLKGVIQGIGNANMFSMIRYARKYLRPHEYIEFIKKCLIEIDKKQIQHFIKIVANAFHKIVQVLNKVFLIIKAIPPEDINQLVLNNQKSINYKSNFFTEKRIKIHGLIQPEHEELLKARKLYDRLDINNMINFTQFYMFWGVEIQKLNINKIDCLDKLISKVKGYKKYRHKLIRKGKVKKCINCCFRMGSREHIGRCAVRPVLNDKKEFDYFTSVHDEYRCDLWYSKYPEDKAKKFVTRVFDDLASSEEEDDHIEI